MKRMTEMVQQELCQAPFDFVNKRVFLQVQRQIQKKKSTPFCFGLLCLVLVRYTKGKEYQWLIPLIVGSNIHIDFPSID